MNGNDNHPVAKQVGESYDENAVSRLTRMESRISAVEVDVATIKSSFATKDDLHAMQMALLDAIKQQGLELRANFDARSDGLLTRIQNLELLIQQQRTELLGLIQQQRIDTERFVHAQQTEMLKHLAGQAWRMYSFAAVLLGAVYFIARTIH